MAELVNQGNLLPDALILRVLRERMAAAAAEGSARFLLDGFPRTAEQAAALEGSADVQLALNLDLREEVLVEKCLGRRLCTKCGKNYNVADIHLAAGKGRPEIVMPPLSPPPECAPFMEQRSDDNEETIRRRLEVGAMPLEAAPQAGFLGVANFVPGGGWQTRCVNPVLACRLLQVYKREAAPVEDFYRKHGVLVNFEITGGIPETLPRLLEVLQPFAEGKPARQYAAA